MKKQIIVCTWLCVALGASAQGFGSITNAGVDASATVIGVTAADTWGASYFWAGFGMGFVWGGIAFVYRVIRQATSQNPEI